MNQDHHEQLALDAARTLTLLPSGVPDQTVRKIVNLLGDRDVRWQYKESASLPDRIRDTALELPDFFPDKYNVKGHNLSSFQHFQCNDGGEGRGYAWNKDSSLSVLGPLDDELMHLFHTFVRYRQDRGGERPPQVDGTTPMADCAQAHPNCVLDDFVFPSAAKVGSFYAAGARANLTTNPETWRRCAGFALHFVQDALVPHHCWGTLLFGHSEWEDQIAAFWSGHVRRIQFVDGGTGKLYAETVAKAVANELQQTDLNVTSIDALIRANATYTAAWLKKDGHSGPSKLDECPPNTALRVCIRAVASSVRALTIMAG